MLDLKEIIRYAVRSHEGQFYGNFPYSTHLSDVYDVLIEFGIQDSVLLAGAWLHDILEDRDRNYADIKRIADIEVAEVVYAVTDEKGKNRKERHEKTWPGILSIERAIVLKQADMIANMRRGIREKSRQLQMYRKEYPEFRVYFYPKGNKDLWIELDRLAEHKDKRKE